MRKMALSSLKGEAKFKCPNSITAKDHQSYNKTLNLTTNS